MFFGEKIANFFFFKISKIPELNFLWTISRNFPEIYRNFPPLGNPSEESL